MTFGNTIVDATKCSPSLSVGSPVIGFGMSLAWLCWLASDAFGQEHTMYPVASPGDWIDPSSLCVVSDTFRMAPSGVVLASIYRCGVELALCGCDMLNGLSMLWGALLSSGDDVLVARLLISLLDASIRDRCSSFMLGSLCVLSDIILDLVDMLFLLFLLLLFPLFPLCDTLSCDLRGDTGRYVLVDVPRRYALV